MSCKTQDPGIIQNVKGYETSISGIVINNEKNEPINDATVHVLNTSKKISTENNGEFSLNGIPQNRIQLKVEKPGFQTYYKDISLIDSSANSLILPLETSLIPAQNQIAGADTLLQNYEELIREYTTLKTQLGKAEEDLFQAAKLDAKDQQGLKRFNEFYITDDPGKCFALDLDNVEVSYSDKDSEDLELLDTARFTVVNFNLGYKVDVYLKGFKAKRDKAGLLMNTSAEYIFEELTPILQEERNEWEENRAELFRGSFRHFLMALASDREPAYYGYKVYKGNSVMRATSLGSNYGKVVDNEVLKESYLREEFGGFTRSFNFQGVLKVEYVRRTWGDQDAYYSTYGAMNETSWLRLSSPEIDFSVNGVLQDPDEVGITGYWSLKKVCDMLPEDYLPNTD